MTGRLIGAAVALVAGGAHADGAVGVVVTGEATMQSSMSAELAGWLGAHGHPVDPTALPADAVNTLVDCFVIDDATCAWGVVEHSARTDSIVYARVAVTGGGADRDVSIVAYWITKGHEPVVQRTVCKRCADDALKITTESMLVALFGADASAPAAAQRPAAVVAVVPVERPHAPLSGLAVGAELGEPTSATAAWFQGLFAIDAAIGTGTFHGPGLSLHVDAQYLVKWLRPDVPLRVGLGGRYYNQHYKPASIDEVPSSSYGIRAPVSVALERGPMEIYAELAPGIDLKRTPSCTLASGPYSICPHAQEGPLFVQFAVGARWFLSH